MASPSTPAGIEPTRSHFEFRSLPLEPSMRGVGALCPPRLRELEIVIAFSRLGCDDAQNAVVHPLPRSEPRVRGEVVGTIGNQGTQTNARSRSMATCAATACDPSPPATPRASAPLSTASSARRWRSSPGPMTTYSIPRRWAFSAMANLAALPPPDLGFANSTGWAAGLTGMPETCTIGGGGLRTAGPAFPRQRRSEAG